MFSKEYRVQQAHYQVFSSSLPYRAVSETIDYARIMKALVAVLDDSRKKNLLMSLKTLHLYGIDSQRVKEAVFESLLDDIKNEKILIALAYHLTEYDAYSAACKEQIISRITDQDALNALVRNAHHRFLRQAVIEKIRDETLLIDLANNDRDFSIRKKALMAINDRKALLDIAKNSNSIHLRLIATGKITDQSALIDLAKNGRDVAVRKKALMKITDTHVLTDLARSDKDETIRNAAKKRINSL
jgi:hypothetical protein